MATEGNMKPETNFINHTLLSMRIMLFFIILLSIVTFLFAYILHGSLTTMVSNVWMEYFCFYMAMTFMVASAGRENQTITPESLGMSCSCNLKYPDLKLETVQPSEYYT